MSVKKNKKCVYTALTGGYDNLLQPDCIAEDYDYICFSNDIKEEKVGVWQIKPIPFKHKDNKRIACFAKMHPHILLEDYEYCIWLDANNKFKDNNIYAVADKFYLEGVTIGHIAHPLRNCIYKEVFVNIDDSTDSTIRFIKTLYFLLKNDYPYNAGLFENNCIYWSHHNPIVTDALDMFWKIYMNNSKRDQLSLGYVYYKLNIHPALLLPEGESMRNSTHIERVNHTDADKRHKLTTKKCAMNRVKKKLVRILFRLMGYDLSYQTLYKKL